MANQDYWLRIAENYRAAFERLSKQEASEVSVDGTTIRYEDRGKLLKMLREAEKRAGVGVKRKRILEQF